MISIHDELHFEPARLWLDARRSRAASFVSHAHTDHIGSHALTICTPATAQLMQLRLGRRPGAAAKFTVREYGETFEHEGIPMRLVPAGHILGSAQLHAQTPQGTFLYTGDFMTRPGRTHAACEVPRCDVLVMECTFGRPHYRFPFRAEVEAELVRICADAIAASKTPIVYAYALGKAQEVISALNEAGIPVMVHPTVAEICDVYRAAGIELGPYKNFDRDAVTGHAFVTPPETRRMKIVERLPNRVDIAVTGWARDASAKFRLGVDVALAYSDHADFPELLDFVARAGPRKVYCLHGFPEFVHHLRRAGVNAEWLAPNVQMELFR
jgi:Cft2 family RNA processing exonuclease